MKLLTDINNIKKRLILKAQKIGLYENFGDKEIRKLKDKYNYNDLRYGDQKERYKAFLIESFDKWCRNVNDNDLK